VQASEIQRLRRKEVMAMNRQKLTPGQKLERLSEQLEVVQRGQEVIERFERAAQKWLNRVQAAKEKA